MILPSIYNTTESLHAACPLSLENVVSVPSLIVMVSDPENEGGRLMLGLSNSSRFSLVGRIHSDVLIDETVSTDSENRRAT